jgi:sortase (surface protein transpeptidase)
MNAAHDPHVIARLRAALDEVAAAPTVAIARPPRPAMSARRWTAVAASVVLVAGAITAIAVNQSHRHSVSPAGASDSTAPPNSSSTTSATLPYFLAAADLAPGPVGADECCLSSGESVIAWAFAGDPSQGLLIAHGGYPQAGVPATSTPSATDVAVDGTALIIDSYGLTAEERDALAAQIVPGSGLPWILPADGWEWMGMETGADRALWYHQTFGGTVLLDAHIGAGILLELTTATDVRSVQVAGEPGWVATYGADAGSATRVFWRNPADGTWMRMTIPAAMADRVDGLIAAVVPAGESSPASTVPTPEPAAGVVSLDTAVSSYALAPYDASTLDPAVGQPIPPIRLTDGATLTVETPTLFVFAAHWCPHCTNEIPVLQQAVEDGTLAGVHVVVVSTAADIDQVQQAAWLAGAGWTGDVLYDTSSGDRAPGVMAGYFGLPAYPYLVMVDGGGMVAGRAVGEVSVADIVALTDIAGPSEAPQAAGGLQIPTIDVSAFVVDGSSGLDVAARLGPVLLGSALPTTLRAQPASDPVSVTIFGHGAIYGSPFLRLGELRAGDGIVWTDESGTATFEVVATATCVSAAVTDCPPASAQDQLVLLTEHPDVTTQGWLMVTARRVPQ